MSARPTDTQAAAGAAPAAPRSSLARRAARFLSTRDSFNQPLGPNIRPGSVHGYYVDLRVKADQPRWGPGFPGAPGSRLWVIHTQKALGSYERWLAGEGDPWLDFARSVADGIVAAQRADGGLVHDYDFPHTFPLSAPWISAMAQGQAASLLVRVHAQTGEERYAEAARRALEVLERPSAEGGTMASLDGAAFPEEYPTDPPSYVLNGGIYAIWGLYDVAVGLSDRPSAERFERYADTLARSIHRWDLGWWSRYDLYPHPRVNVASLAYHALHIAQLEATHKIAPRPQLAAAAERFTRYELLRRNRVRAFAAKVAFRLRVPRA